MKVYHAFLVSALFSPSVLAEGYKENWWMYDYIPDLVTFLHMASIVFWWGVAAVPAMIVGWIALAFLKTYG